MLNFRLFPTRQKNHTSPCDLAHPDMSEHRQRKQVSWTGTLVVEGAVTLFFALYSITAGSYLISQFGNSRVGHLHSLVLVWEQAGQEELDRGAQREVLWGRGAWGIKKDGRGISCPKGSSPCGLRVLTWTPPCEDVRCVGALHWLTVQEGSSS